jgi:signal transduction histidine kinase
MIALCQTDGGVLAVNQALSAFVDLPETATLGELALLIGCGGLKSKFEAFAGSAQASAKFSLSCRGRNYQVAFQSLNQGQRRLILIELVREDEGDEHKRLLEAGRMTSRLIHDFKNQMGGLKLYAAYLKKRFADQPEGLEISEKIVQGLNAMAEQSALISKLTRPLELKREPQDPSAIVSQTINDQKLRAAARNVRIELGDTENLPRLSLDAQQLRSALGSILARAIDSSPEGGAVTVNWRTKPGEAQIEIVDSGDALSESQRNSLFDILTSDRINSARLDLALARRIVERHGGEIVAHPHSAGGAVVQVKLPV